MLWLAVAGVIYHSTLGTSSDKASAFFLTRVLTTTAGWKMIVIGHSYREMSQRLGVAEGTLRVRVLRCREKAVAARHDLLGTGSGNGRNITVKRPPNRSGGANADEL